MYGTKIYRAGNFFYRKKLIVISKLFYIANHLLNCCDIPVELELGENSGLGHGGNSVVINGDSIIGRNVIISQNVTIGGKGGERPPIICDNVYISPGVRILGNVTIGQFSIIGANAVIVKDVEEYSIMGGVPGKRLNVIEKSNFEKYAGYFPFAQNPFKVKNENQ